MSIAPSSSSIVYRRFVTLNGGGKVSLQFPLRYDPRPTLVQGTLRGKWGIKNLVAPCVDVGVSRGLDDLSRVSLAFENGDPALALVVTQGSLCIEQPVAIVTHDRFDLGDLIVGEGQARVYNVGVLGGDDYFRVRCALGRVVDAAAEVYNHSLGQTLFEISIGASFSW